MIERLRVEVMSRYVHLLTVLEEGLLRQGLSWGMILAFASYFCCYSLRCGCFWVDVDRDTVAKSLTGFDF